MKLKYLSHGLITALCILGLSSCLDKQGTEPGNDAEPVVTMYLYAAPDEYNPDQTAYVRFAPNSKVSNLYILVDEAAAKTSFIETSGEDAYMRRVISEGDRYAGTLQDLIFEDLQGAYEITAVAESADGACMMASVYYKGIRWVEAGQAWVQENISGHSGYVNVLRQDDSNIFRVVGLYTQLDSELGSPTENFDFTFDNDHNLASFSSTNSPYFLVGYENGTRLYHGYYNTASYSSYCYVQTSADSSGALVGVVRCLILDNNAGSLYTGGILYIWMDEVEWAI